MYGVPPLPITLEYEWFSMITTTVWSGRGTAASAAGRFAVVCDAARIPARRRILTRNAWLETTVPARMHPTPDAASGQRA